MLEEGNVCPKEREIQLIWESLNKLSTTINGNGVPGMKSDIACIKNDVSNTKDDIKNIDSNMEKVTTGMEEIKISLEAMKSSKSTEEKIKLNSRQRTAIIITGITGISGMVITLIFEILKIKTNGI